MIVAKGFHAGEKNGNIAIGGGPFPAGDNGGGAISFGNESSYGPDDPNGFSYPASTGNFGTAHQFLAGTFNFTISVSCSAANRADAIDSVTQPLKQPVKGSIQPLIVKTKELNIYPNPTRGQFTIQLTGVSAPVLNVQVMNANGRLIEQKTIGAATKTALLAIPFNLVNQPPGLYLVKVETADGILTEKIIIQR